MDLLVGIWAEKRIPQLSEDNLGQFELILDQENPDLYKWLTGQEQPPADIANNTAYQVISLGQQCIVRPRNFECIHGCRLHDHQLEQVPRVAVALGCYQWPC